MNFELKIKKYQNTSTGKWETALSDGYEKIRGKVFDIKMYKKDPRTIKNAEGKRVPTDPPEYLDNGYWTAKVELSGIHLAKSIPSEAVPEEKIKNDDFKPGRPWDLDYPGDTFFKYVAYEASEWLENEFKRIYGTKIKLDAVVSNDPSSTPTQDPIPNPPIQQAAVSSGAFTADYISTNSTDALNDPISISYIITKDLGDGKEPVYINVNDSKNFSIDQVTKKIKILVSNVFYDINGNWFPQYGSVALIPKEQILDLSGYPDKPQIDTLPPKRISTIDNKVTSDGISKPLPVQKDYTFDVREPETFFNTKLGKFFIIGRGVIREEEIERPEEAYLEGDEEDEYVESENDIIEMIIELQISDASGDFPDTPVPSGGEGGTPAPGGGEGGTPAPGGGEGGGEGAKLGKQQNAGGTGHKKFQKQRTINGRLCKNGELPSDLMVPIPWQKGQLIEKNAFKQLEKLNEAFKAEFNKNMPIICGFRSMDVQDRLFNWPLYESTGKKQTYQGNACAPPGTSLHGWGQAVDIDGLHGANKSVAGNKKFAWLMENSKKYNWIKPSWANTGSGPSYEPWHFEYTGTDLFKP